MRGVLELLPGEQVAFQQMLATIRRGYERFGFLPIETPVLEYTDILLTKTGGDTEKQVYLAQSTGARKQGYDPKLALRFDLTVPLARYVAEHEHDLHFPFRRYQIQRVYRGESAQKGRFREFYQCDIDVIGRDKLNLAYDAEIPAVIAQIFGELGIGAFTIGINNRKLLAGFFEAIGVDNSELRQEVLREVDKLDKKGESAVRASLAQPPMGLDGSTIDRIFEFVGIGGGNAEILESLGRLKLDGDLFNQGLAELRTVVTMLDHYELPSGCYRINLSIARGLDYYTGTVYETLLDEHPEIGSVCSGGRYDDLASYYTKSKLPGVGISIGLTRLFSQMQELGKVQLHESPITAMICPVEETAVASCTSLAAQLRTAGVTTEVILEPMKLRKQMKLVSRRGAAYAIIIGPSEASDHSAILRSMDESSQVTLPQADIVERLSTRTRG